MDNYKKKFIFPQGFRSIPILIFTMLFVFLVVQPIAWAGLSSLSVDAEGDSIFNGENEKLRINFSTSDFGDENQEYKYKVLVDNRVEPIFEGPEEGFKLSKNQSVSLLWDGRFKKGDNREKFPDGDYTIKVILEDNTGTTLPLEVVVELTADATIDTKAPEISIDVGHNEFSPDLYSIPVYYSIDEDVKESTLLFQRAPGDASTGRPVPLNLTSGSHTYYWDGDDNSRRAFDDGQYTLKLKVIDKAGNEVTSNKTENITIDSEEPRITGISINNSISLVGGLFTNAIVQTISFSADADGGTPLDLNGRDTEVFIRPVDGQNIKGTITYGNQPTFTLGNPLDDLAENGEYEVTVFISDRVGNLASDRVKFTFDNVPPILKSVATNRGELTPGTGLNGWTNYVEAVLEDNIQLNLASSSIRLKGPDGSVVLGQQSQHNNEKIRWKLLSPLLAKDGLQDGQYTIEIIGKDKAENDTTPIQISFLFDNLPPELVSLKPSRDGEPFNILGDTIYYNSPINQFVATYSDGEFGTGAVYNNPSNNSRIEIGTKKEDGEINRKSGRTFTDSTNDVVTFILNTPLIKTDGSQDGEYLINVKAVDKLGNSDTYPLRFVFDTQLPTLRSTIPAANKTVTDLTEVVVKLNEVTSGIDFVQSNFQLKRSDAENQVDIPVNIKTNGIDTVTLTLLQPIALDGSDDGTYTIEVIPTDLAGNTGAVVRRQFYLVSQTQPKVKLTIPDTSAVSTLGDITVAIENYIGSGIDFDVSTITVSNPQGIAVPQAKVEADEANNQLIWSTEAAIPRNGTADGEYTVTVVFVDFSGQYFTGNFTIGLDTQFPDITAVSVGTDPQQNLSINSATDINETFSQITVEFDEQDIDFENTIATLTTPDATEIAIHRSDDGINNLVLDFQNLSQLGTYTLAVTPIDRIGNVSVTPFIYRFHLDIDVPVVTSVLIGNQSGAVAYVNASAGAVIATLTDSTGTGLALGEGESSIIVTAESGLPVPGITISNDDNQLIWTPIALPTDGSADGRYTVAITPVDKAGRTGDIVYRSFIFDTQVPRISDSSPVVLHQPISYIGGSLTQLQFTVEDVGPALLDLDVQTISLQKKDGQTVQGQITNDGINQLFYTLSAPLATDGSADGEYILTVNLVDQSENSYQVEHTIFYDSQAPRLTSVSLSTETPLDLTPYQVTDLSDSINSLTLTFQEMTRVDFANTTTTLIGPDGSSIPLSLENNGVDQLKLSFVTLTQGGLYTLSVTPQDIAQNVAQGAVPYPFRLQFEVPGLSSVFANTPNKSIELIPHEIIQISETINSLVIGFTDNSRIDFENTHVMLTDINGQEISVTTEKNADTELVVRFVSLRQSGLYVLAVTPQDRSGNTVQSPIRYQFRLDIALPTVKSVLIDGKSSPIIYVNDADFSIIATFIEPTGVGLAFGDEGSNIVVTNANGLTIPGIAESNGTDQIDWVTTALPPDGSADGRYTVSITPIDKTGRTGKVVNQEFIYDTQAPRITSSTPATLHQPISYIGGSLTQFQFTIEDIGPASFDIDSQTIGLNQMDGQPVKGEITHDGTNQLFFTLTNPIPTDGSADGKYILNVTLVDKADNLYQTEHDIFYDSQAPEISSVSLNTQTPLDLIPYQVADLSETINEVSLKFDETTRVDFSNTTITLMGPDNSVIPLTLKNNGVDELIVSFVTLTRGGEYTLSVTPQDIAGNAAQGAVSYPFRLKLEVPGLSSVAANTSDGSIALTPYESVDISESVNSITLSFTDSNRIDFENTVVSLTSENGQEISVNMEVDGSNLYVRFVPLTQSAMYILSVTPQDITGNIAKNTAQYQFRLTFPLPSVSSVLIDGKPGSTVYVSKSIPIVIATFSDNNGIDLSLEEDGSTIVVTNPEGIIVPGVTTSNGTDQLTWRPAPLPTDGTADGRYAVTITPVDKSGRTGTVVNQQFIYDSQAPRITSATPLTIHAPVSYIGGGLSQFVISIEDVGPAGIVLASQVAALQDASGNSILATLTYDEIAGQVYLTLTQPFANDGSMDGTYTLNVLLIDKAGNRLNSRFNIIYDSKMPQVASVTANTVGNPTALVHNQVTNITESISKITIKFAEATLVDFANTTVSLLDPDFLTVPITSEDDGVSQITLNFVGLTQIGQYTLTIIPQDVAGNTTQIPIQYSFVLEFILPDIESIVIGDTVTLGSGDIAYVNADNLTIIANLLDPAETGLSFDVITGSEILVATIDNIIVPGATASNGTDLLIWEPVTLSTDGSSDGRYAVYITPVDKEGRAGNTAYREFIYDTQEPEITSADPINLSQPVSYISDSLTQLSFTLQDVGPADIILDDQKVSILNQNGVLIPTQLTHDSNNQFYLTLDEPLPLDGSRDGEYTVVTAFSDKAGNVLDIEHPIVYDTQAPTLVSTVPANGAQLTDDVTQIQVNLDDKGDSGIDWASTTIILIDPNGETISGELTSNGKTQLTLHTNQLVADGRYVIRVQAIDRAGNGSNSVFENSFLLSRRLPAILSTSPTTAPAEEAYTNEEVEEVEVRLETADDNHLSTLRLLNADGQVVAGQQKRSSGRLVYTLIRPLATDGSEDGIYTIQFTPISASGRSGEVQQLAFTYDTQVPEIEVEDITLVVTEPEVNNSLIEIQVPITDNQSGIDWENLDEEWIHFERVSPNATDIEGRVSFNEQDNLVFRLAVPLADNGSADGKYRIEVTPADQAGNGDETYEKVFTYDTSPPVIDPNSLLLNDLPLLTDITAEDYPSAISTTGGVVIQASVTDTGLGVNLSQSRIVITNPNGQEVSGTTHQNGVDTIIFKSNGLPVEGIYQVNVTGIGNDSELLGFAPKGSITTEFLYETTKPVGVVTDDGGKTELTDEPIPFQGTATDPQGVRRVPPQQGDGEIPIPASGVWLVEIVGTGPDGQPIEPVPAEDESDAQEQPWSSWTADFLPTRSGEYDLDLRVTDKAGNFDVYDIGEYTMSVSFSFSGNTFGWPNPLRHSKSDVAFFSFDLNAAAEENVELVLYIYDWGGDLVYSKTYTDIIPGERSDTHIKWNLENQSGNPVARGIYVFRLEAVNGAGNRANAVGKILVVD